MKSFGRIQRAHICHMPNSIRPRQVNPERGQETCASYGREGVWTLDLFQRLSSGLGLALHVSRIYRNCPTHWFIARTFGSPRIGIAVFRYLIHEVSGQRQDRYLFKRRNFGETLFSFSFIDTHFIQIPIRLGFA